MLIFFQKYIPSKQSLLKNKNLSFLKKYFNNRDLWRISRSNIAKSVALGMFCAWIPVPFQMVLATAGAILLSVNLPIAVALVWITNPITMPALYVIAYQLGSFMLDSPAAFLSFELSSDALMDLISKIWKPFLLGCFTIGTVSAVIGYLAVYSTWKMHIIKRWKNKTNQ